MLSFWANWRFYNTELKEKKKKIEIERKDQTDKQITASVPAIQWVECMETCPPAAKRDIVPLRESEQLTWVPPSTL